MPGFIRVCLYEFRQVLASPNRRYLMVLEGTKGYMKSSRVLKGTWGYQRVLKVSEGY